MPGRGEAPGVQTAALACKGWALAAARGFKRYVSLPSACFRIIPLGTASRRKSGRSRRPPLPAFARLRPPFYGAEARKGGFWKCGFLPKAATEAVIYRLFSLISAYFRMSEKTFFAKTWRRGGDTAALPGVRLVRVCPHWSALVRIAVESFFCGGRERKMEWQI